jgi:hypothetical protein
MHITFKQSVGLKPTPPPGVGGPPCWGLIKERGVKPPNHRPPTMQTLHLLSCKFYFVRNDRLVLSECLHALQFHRAIGFADSGVARVLKWGLEHAEIGSFSKVTPDGVLVSHRSLITR